MKMRLSLRLSILVLANVAGLSDAFTASLARPWDVATVSGKRGSSLSLHVTKSEGSNAETSDKGDEKSEASDDTIEDDGSSTVQVSQQTTSNSVSLKNDTATARTVRLAGPGDNLTSKLNSTHSSYGTPTKYVEKMTTSEPTVRSTLPNLVAMTRPENLPVVALLHMLGAYMVTRTINVPYWPLIASPVMMVTLLALLLTSSTSMLVNDYYDYKLGNDANKVFKPLSSKTVPLIVAKRFLSYLYAAALVCVSAVPGIPARLSVVVGLMLTFWYTQHLKPKTWLKNTVCASLIALSPLTSGTAAMTLTQGPLLGLAPLFRVVSMLFVGILGREICMDINDVQDDKAHGVRTVPVVYGRRFASATSLACSLGVTGIATSGNLLQLLSHGRSNTVVRRLLLSSIGSMMQLRRSFLVFQSNGEDPVLVNKAVEEGLISVVLLLASFV